MAHEKPSFVRLLRSVWPALVNEIFRAGGSKETIEWLDTPAARKTIERMAVAAAEGFSRRDAKVEQEQQDGISKDYTLVVDADQTVTEMIIAGDYEIVHGEVASLLEVIGYGQYQTTVVLVHPGLQIMSMDAIRLLHSMNLMPARPEELLALGVRYPHLQLEFPIAALEIEGYRPSKTRQFLQLTDSFGKRALDTHGGNYIWPAETRFLAVRGRTTRAPQASSRVVTLSPQQAVERGMPVASPSDVAIIARREDDRSVAGGDGFISEDDDAPPMSVDPEDVLWEDLPEQIGPAVPDDSPVSRMLAEMHPTDGPAPPIRPSGEELRFKPLPVASPTGLPITGQTIDPDDRPSEETIAGDADVVSAVDNSTRPAVDPNAELDDDDEEVSEDGATETSLDSYLAGVDTSGDLDTEVEVTKVNRESHLLTVNYEQSLEQLLMNGEFQWAHHRVNSDNFTIRGVGKQEVSLVLLHINREVPTSVINDVMQELGLKPARIEHLLVFGARFKEYQEKFPIAALGSVWVDKFDEDQSGFVPTLGVSKKGRRVQLNYAESLWKPEWRFLAFKEPEAA